MSSSSCPPDQTLLELGADRAAPGGRPPALEQAASHLAGCARCTERLAQLAIEDRTLIRSDALPAPGARGRLARGATVGRYMVLELIGEGGMGEVYAAYDPQLDRRVALKLLRPSEGAEAEVSEGQLRLLREARALARLAHPNVIAVHDVGEIDGQVFIAVELVEGLSLRRWLLDRPRGVAEILDVFRAAGLGLQAAHDAGLVHRDFKPDNVLVGGDGRVRVLDFGLARSAAEAAPGVTSALRVGADLPPQHDSVTLQGSVVGTPAYMAPEQVAGQPVDAKCDQFSFCVSLFEALHGKKPFGGASLSERHAAIQARRLEPSTRRDVPPHLQRVIARGLEPVATDRFGTMRELLWTLDHDPALRRRRALAIAGAVVAVLAVVAGGASWRVLQREQCLERERALAGAWEGAKQDALRASFEAAGEMGADAWSRIRPALDNYTDRLATETCRSDRPEPPGGLRELREDCLESRRAAARALIAGLGPTDRAALASGARAAHALPAVDVCADLARLARAMPEPTPEQRSGVQQLRTELAAAQAEFELGRYEAARARALELAKGAEVIGHRASLAEVSLLLGRIDEKLGRYQDASARLQEAARAALEGGAAELLARSWAMLAMVEAVRLSRLPQGESWAGWAASANERAGSPPELEGELNHVRGLLQLHAGRYPEAEASFVRARQLLSAAHGTEHPLVANTLNNLGIIANRAGRFDQALAAHAEALRIRRAALGERHPEVGVSLHNIGAVHQRKDNFREAERHYRQALEIRVSQLGEGHPLTFETRQNLGQIALKEGRVEEALAIARTNLARAEEMHGPAHERVGHFRFTLGTALEAAKQPRAAVEQLERAIALYDENLGPDHPKTSQILRALARVHLQQGEHRPCAEAALRSARICEVRSCAPVDRALSHAFAADCLRGRDRRRAQEHARKAAAFVEEARDDRETAAFRQWLDRLFPELARAAAERAPR